MRSDNDMGLKFSSHKKVGSKHRDKGANGRKKKRDLNS